MITQTRVGQDVVALSAAVPGPDAMTLPVHAYCMLGQEPVLVDTGLSPLGEQFREALWRLVDPEDLRWIVVTHDDRDHTGSLRAILDQAPQATVVTNFISMVKIAEDWPLPMDRLRLVNSGDRLDIGDDVLDIFRPPTYDSPGTLAFHALRRNTCFSSDCLGAFVPTRSTWRERRGPLRRRLRDRRRGLRLRAQPVDARHRPRPVAGRAGRPAPA